SLDRLLQERRGLAGQSTRGAQRIKAVIEAILVDQRRQCADLFEPLGRRHLDASLGAQPAPVVETVLGDDAHLGCGQILQPREHSRRIEVLAVEMADREIVAANAGVITPSNADPADIPAAPGPRRTTICAYSIVARLNVERDDPDPTQIG